jgi:hypothetical protein
MGVRKEGRYSQKSVHVDYPSDSPVHIWSQKRSTRKDVGV